MFKSNQTRYAVSPGYVECKTKRILGIACLGKKLVFHTEICDYFKYLFFKYSIFRRVKELFKSNQTRYAVSPGCVECKTKRIFGIACLGKKLVFHTEICDYFKYLFFKYSIFRRVKELFKSNQTRYAVSPGCVECKTKRIFGIACLGKKLVFHTEICDYFKYLFFKYSIFRRVKELFKSNQTRYAVSPGCVECKTKRIFGIACLGKKLVFHTEICDYFKYLFFKYSIFRRVKELFKSNQTRYAVSPGCVECKTKRIFGIACLGKKLVFHTEICDYFKYLFFKYSIFHRVKELFKLNQTWYRVSPGYVESKTKRIFAIACLGEKSVFHTEMCNYFE